MKRTIEPLSDNRITKMYFAGKNFYNVCELLTEKNSYPFMEIETHGPLFCNMLICIEIFLKYILINNNKNINLKDYSHNISSLYNTIPEDVKESLNSVINSFGIVHDITTELVHLDGALVSWRYIYEKLERNIEIFFISDLTNALFIFSTDIYNNSLLSIK